MEPLNDRISNKTTKSQHPDSKTDISLQGSSKNTPSSSSPKSHFACPICGESMVALAQLNQHIDDLHGENNDEKSNPFLSPKKMPNPRRKSDNSTHGNPMRSYASQKTTHLGPRTPQKRILKLDLDEDNSRFSLSENGEGSEQTGVVKLTRAHWKHILPHKANICAAKGCKNVLNVRNGMSNCRRCGNLFCDEHTKYRARLVNPKISERSSGPNLHYPIYDSKCGALSKVCHECYIHRPSVKIGTLVKSVDLTAEFMLKRRKTVDTRQLERSMVHSRFLKLADLQTEKYLWEKSNTALFSGWITPSKFSQSAILDAEKEIVGVENWVPDEDASHCKLCFLKFNFLIRKHHCRLCGSIVNDGSFSLEDPAQFCSAQVPLRILMGKLPSLNYSPTVKSHWDSILHESSDSACTVRICRTCKNLLLHDTDSPTASDAREHSDVLDAYDQILALKATIHNSMTRYRVLITENNEAHNHQTNRLRVRLQKSVKDLETIVNSFLNRFFAVDPALKKLAPLQSPKLVANIYKAATACLQELVLELKLLNDKFRDFENRKLAGQVGTALPHSEISPSSLLLSATVLPGPTSVHSPRPRLTKKQIRELREQLMVTNEQKFIIESLIEDVKRLRKFDELIPLEENRKELGARVEELTRELGEFGF